jgi:DNA-binding winged helix-turn-helix (wHTH) protein
MNSTATPDSVRASIKRLRSTLEEIGLDQYLESARNRGYRLQ